MAVEELYKVELRGADIVALALARMDAEAKKSAQAFATHAGPSQQAASSFSQKVGGLADAFKMVSRDIGTLGGQSAQAFTHMADEALSVASILTGGFGITAAIAVTGLAIGGLRALWVAEEEEMKKATERRLKALQDTKDIVAKGADYLAQAQSAATEDQATRLLAEIEATERMIEIRQIDVATAEQQRTTTVSATKEKWENVRALKAEVASLQMSVDVKTAGLGELEKELELRAKMRRQIEAHEKAVARAREVSQQMLMPDMGAGAVWAAVLKPIAQQIFENDRAVAESNREMARGVVENLDQIEGAWRAVVSVTESYRDEISTGAAAQLSRVLESERSGLAQKKNALVELERLDVAREKQRHAVFLEELNLQMQQRQLSDEQAAALAITDGQLSAERIKNREAETRAAIDALERQKNEQVKATAAMAYAASVNTAYSTSMYAVGKGIDYASSELQRFQDINQDNYRDLLQINENTMAAWAKRLQAFLFMTAMEAGRMALMENAAGLAETARGAGALFTNPAEAASHFVSAGIHYASSSAYAAFAGGAAVGFGVVAASRGQGGLFAAAEKEDEKGKARDGSPSGGGGSSVGSSSSRGERGGGGAQPIIVNITNEPGAIHDADSDRAAQVVARHVARANRDWFTRQEMN